MSRTRIINFRGLLLDSTKQRIRLSTRDGKTGYRIKKFQLMANNPGAQDHEAVVKIFSVEPVTNTATVNFDDPTLLAAGFYTANASAFNYPATLFTIFDNVKVNQDIWITLGQDSHNFKNTYVI